jgi:hypothetical protein
MTTPLISMIRPVFVPSDPFSDKVLLRSRLGRPREGAPGRGVYLGTTPDRLQNRLEALNGTLTGGAGVSDGGGYPGDVGTRTWLAVAVIAVLVAGGVVLAGLALGGGDSQSSAAEYQVAAVQARDRVDFALGRLSRAQSLDELTERMDEAAATIDGAAGELDGETPPQALADEHERLVEQIGVLAGDVQGTADQLRVPGFEDILTGAQGLNFESWDEINAVLVKMKGQGVVVPLLSRHETS